MTLKATLAKEKKLCYRCKSPTDGTRARCADCTKIDSLREVQRQRQRHASGLCPTCKAPRGNRYRCKKCQTAYVKRQARSRQRRVDQGQCWVCGQVREHHARYCNDHLAKYQDYQRSYRQRKCRTG